MKKIRKMRKSLVIPAALLSLALVWAGCSGGSSTPPPTPITNTTQAKAASSSSSQSVNLATGSGLIFINLGSIGGGSLAPSFQFKAPKSMKPEGGTAIASKLSAKFAKSSAATAATAAVKKAAGMKTTGAWSGSGIPCTDGGTYSFDGTFDDVASTYDLTFVFTDCKESDSKFNGTYHLAGTATSVTMTMTGFSIVEYAPGSGYTGTPVSSMSANLALAASFSQGAAGDFVLTMTGNGAITATEAGITYTLAYTNLSISDSFSVDDVSTPTSETYTMTMNGGVSEGWTPTGGSATTLSLTFENYIVSLKIYTSGSVLWDEETTVNGVVTVNFTPDAYCLNFEGRFSIQTTVPIYWDETVLHTTAGTVIINGNTTIIFNADGSVTVQYSSTPITGMENVPMATLDAVCDFATM